MNNKIIIGLIVLIIILSIILVLKVTGVIKPKKSSYVSIQNTSIENLEYPYSALNNNNDNFEKDFNKITNRITFITIIISILIIVSSFVCIIGISKLYLKLSMPVWTSKFIIIDFLFSIVLLCCSPILFFISQIISIIISFVVLYYFIDAVGLSGWWVFAGFIPIVGAIILLGLSIITNIKLATIFNKSTLFTLGLILLPFIFQPILGYKKEENIFS